MKLFAKLMIAVLFIAMLLPFTILKDKNGDTLMSFSDLSLPDFSLSGLPDMPDAGEITPSIDLGGKDVFYKWYDADGNLQFTTEPPPDGIEYTAKGFDPNANVIQAVKLPQPETEAGETAAAQEPSSGTDGIGNPYSPEAIEKLFKDAKNIENILNQRMKDQEAVLNQ